MALIGRYYGFLTSILLVADDDRVKVEVEGLDADGNFIGQIGSDSQLKCQATSKFTQRQSFC